MCWNVDERDVWYEQRGWMLAYDKNRLLIRNTCSLYQHHISQGDLLIAPPATYYNSTFTTSTQTLRLHLLLTTTAFTTTNPPTAMCSSSNPEGIVSCVPYHTYHAHDRHKTDHDQQSTEFRGHQLPV